MHSRALEAKIRGTRPREKLRVEVTFDAGNFRRRPICDTIVIFHGESEFEVRIDVAPRVSALCEEHRFYEKTDLTGNRNILTKTATGPALSEVEGALTEHTVTIEMIGAIEAATKTAAVWMAETEIIIPQ